MGSLACVCVLAAFGVGVGEAIASDAPVAHIAIAPCCGVRGGKIYLLAGSVTAADLAPGAVTVAALAPGVVARLEPAAGSSSVERGGRVAWGPLEPALGVTREPVAHIAIEPCCGVRGGKIYLLAGSVTAVDLAPGAVTVAALAPGVVARLEPPAGSSSVERGSRVAWGPLEPALGVAREPVAHIAGAPCCGRRGGKIYLLAGSVTAADLAPGAVTAHALTKRLKERLKPASAPSTKPSSWSGTADGVRHTDAHSDSGGVTSTSIEVYKAVLSFRFTVGSGGSVTGTGTGHYTAASWHLSGVNGSNGSFDCMPPISTNTFKVSVAGSESAGELILSLAIPDATETNQDYDCGADYTGYASTSHDMTQSLKLVGGQDLHLPASKTTSLTKTKTTTSNNTTNVDTWTFTTTPANS